MDKKYQDNRINRKGGQNAKEKTSYAIGLSYDHRSFRDGVSL